MKIYVNGCSFVYGDELDDRAAQSWPALLGQKLSATVVNDAMLGGSNARTVYRTIKHLDQDFDLYVIVWTFDHKFTFYKSDSNIEVNFNPKLNDLTYGSEDYYRIWGRTLYQIWYNRLYGFKLWLQQILQLQAMLYLHDRQYLMINATDNNLPQWSVDQDQFIDSVKSLINFNIMNDEQIFAEYEEIQYYINEIDRSTFYNWDTFTIRSLCDQFATGPRGHFLEAGHQHLANLIYNHLCSV
jgi:hypothetical protein